MAHVWSHYAASRGEPFTRGVYNVTLFHDGEHWWIVGSMFDASAGGGL